jgi:Raf kinase inhibitor-like YbhB/YbcL family protein
MPMETFTLESPAFADGERLPVRFVQEQAGGQNISPPLAWTNPPSGTRSFALAVIDLHPVAHHFAHWLVADLPAEARDLAEGASPSAMPPGARELPGTSGQRGWRGPRPPQGSGEHDYHFRLYALDVERLDLDEGAAPEEFEAIAQSHALGSASISGFFGR